MTKASTFIDGKCVIVPLDMHDAITCGWHCGVEFRRDWPAAINATFKEIERETTIVEWCRNTFARNSYKKFNGGVYFYREEDAVLCQLRWL